MSQMILIAQPKSINKGLEVIYQAPIALEGEICFEANILYEDLILEKNTLQFNIYKLVGAEWQYVSGFLWAGGVYTDKWGKQGGNPSICLDGATIAGKQIKVEIINPNRMSFGINLIVK